MDDPQFTNCNLCGHDNTKTIFELIDDTYINSSDKYNIVQCNNCHLVYTNPRPNKKNISNHYSKDFISYQFESNEINKSINDKLLSFVTQTSANSKLKIAEKIFKFKQDFKVLDLGCGRQLFLKLLKEKYQCQVLGIDFDLATVEYCRKILQIDTQQGSYQALNDVKSEFDLITMWHYLEHEYEPKSVLNIVHSALKNNGRVIIEVPNIDSLENSIFGKNSYLLDMPRHLYHFSLETLSELLKSEGFEVESTFFPIFSGGYIGTFQRLLCKGKIYKSLKRNMPMFMFLSFISLPFELFSRLVNKGSTFCIVAKKTSQTNFQEN